jgi:hypothetical protein
MAWTWSKTLAAWSLVRFNIRMMPKATADVCTWVLPQLSCFITKNFLS